MTYYTTTWAIQDDNGIVAHGDQSQMEDLFFDAGQVGSDIQEWKGNLELIQIHNIKK